MKKGILTESSMLMADVCGKAIVNTDPIVRFVNVTKKHVNRS